MRNLSKNDAKRSMIVRAVARMSRVHGLSDRVIRRMSWNDFLTIEDDYKKERLAEIELEDRRCARIQAAIYNTCPFKKKGKVYSEDDFMPKKVSDRRIPTAEELYAKTMLIHNALIAKFEAEGGN